MLSLHSSTLPSSAIELARLLNESLRRLFVVDADPAIVREGTYPRLQELSISLDGARLRPDLPRPPVSSGKRSPALEVDHFTLSASPLSLGSAAVNLSLSAREVQFDQSEDANGEIALSPRSAAEGTVEIFLAQTDLEALISQLARDQAEKQGITIDGVQLQLRQESAHALSAEIRLRARKLFLSASLQVTGKLRLDDQLNLKISDLNCAGDGGIATLACGILKPYLEKIEGREFPLIALPLGEIRLRDVRVSVSDNVSVTAEFGAAA